MDYFEQYPSFCRMLLSSPFRLQSILLISGLSWGLMSEGLAQNVTLEKVEVVATTPVNALGMQQQLIASDAQTLGTGVINPLITTNLADLLNDNIGSVSVSNSTGNGYQNDVNYRGFQVTSILGAPVGLSVYFDGVRFNEPFGSIVNWDLIPINAISSMTLMPGSNPLFGLNTLGGAVSANTKNGQDNPGSSLSVMGGSFGRKSLQFERGFSDEGHNTDYFLALNLDHQQGFRLYSQSEVAQWFGKGRWQSDDLATKLELSVTGANNFLRGTQALPLSMMDTPAMSYTWPDSVANQMTLVNFRGSHWAGENDLINGNLFFRQSNSQTINSNAALDDGCYASDGSLSVKCLNLAPNGTVNNSIATNALGLARYTGDINTSLIDSSTVQSTVGGSLQWTNLDALKGMNNSFTLGGAFDYSRIGFDQSSLLARLINYQTVETGNSRYFFPSTGSTSGSNLIDSVHLSAHASDVSLFSSDTLFLNEHWSAVASGSYNVSVLSQSGANQQNLNSDGGYSWTDPSSLINYYNPSFIGSQYLSGSTLKTIAAPGSVAASNVSVANGQAGPQVNSLNGDHHFERFNPALGLNYNPSKQLGFFASYSESMRAPTPIELSCANPNSPCALPTGFNGDPDLKAVVAKTLELGARGKMNPSLSWNVAIYDTRTSNDIEFLYDTSTTGFFSNVGNTQRKGFELGINSNAEPFKWALNYGFVNASFRSAFTTAQGVSVKSGDQIPGIANQTLKLRASYRFTPELSLGARGLLVGSQYAHGDENNQDPSGKVPGYVLVNLDLKYQLNEQLSLVVILNNAFNRTYSTYGILSTNVYTGTNEQFRTPAPPRALWVAAQYKF